MEVEEICSQIMGYKKNKSAYLLFYFLKYYCCSENIWGTQSPELSKTVEKKKETNKKQQQQQQRQQQKR